MLTRRQIEIFMDYYSNLDKFIKAKTLADKYQVSLRTMQNEIKEIKNYIYDHGITLESSVRNGNKLVISDRQVADEFVSTLANNYRENYRFEDQASRVTFILSYLLKNPGYVKSQFLSDSLFISKQRISADLVCVRKILNKYNLSLQSKPYEGIRIVGDEQDKRRCLIKENISFLYDSPLLNLGKDSLMLEIKKILTEILIENQYKVSDVVFQNLIIHITTAICRINDGYYVEVKENMLDNTYEHVYEIAKKIMGECCKRYELIVPEDEIRLLAVNLHGKREYDNQQYISLEINDFIIKSLQKIKSKYGIDFLNDVNLRISLGLHIVPLITRLKSNMQLKNIMTYEIKQKFPLAFDISTAVAYYIYKKYNQKPCDDEIAYMALHFSVALSTISDIRGDNKIIVICPQRKSESILLRQKILEWFRDYIKEFEIVNVNSLDTIDLEDYDAIFTTDRNISSTIADAIYINYFLNQKDYNKIELALNGLTDIQHMIDKFDKDLIFVGNVVSKKDLIKILCDRATSKYKIDGSLYKSVILHEGMANTYCGNLVAIPHPDKPISEETFIAIGILDNDIEWCPGVNTRLVFLVSVEKDNPRAFQIWYYLSYLISNKEAIDRIIKGRSYEVFQKIIYEVYEDIFNN